MAEWNACEVRSRRLAMPCRESRFSRSSIAAVSPATVHSDRPLIAAMEIPWSRRGAIWIVSENCLVPVEIASHVYVLRSLSGEHEDNLAGYRLWTSCLQPIGGGQDGEGFIMVSTHHRSTIGPVASADLQRICDISN